MCELTMGSAVSLVCGTEHSALEPVLLGDSHLLIEDKNFNIGLIS